jgi:hypothetical protein
VSGSGHKNLAIAFKKSDLSQINLVAMFKNLVIFLKNLVGDSRIKKISLLLSKTYWVCQNNLMIVF